MKKLNYSHEIKKIESTKKLRELFFEFITLSNSILKDYRNRPDVEYYQNVYQNLFQRLYIGISAIDTLFDKFKSNKYYKYPIAIQMRTCILDSLTIAYLIFFIDKKDPSRFKEQINRLNQPVARNLRDAIKEMKEQGKMNVDEMGASFYFPDNFINGGLDLNKSIKDLNPKEMSKALKGTSLESYSDIYKYYQHYSSYEHYSTVSKTLLEFETEFEFDKFCFSTFYILQAAFIALQVMEVDSDLIEKMKALGDRIIDIEPTFTMEA